MLKRTGIYHRIKGTVCYTVPWSHQLKPWVWAAEVGCCLKKQSFRGKTKLRGRSSILPKPWKVTEMVVLFKCESLESLRSHSGNVLIEGECDEFCVSSVSCLCLYLLSACGTFPGVCLYWWGARRDQLRFTTSCRNCSPSLGAPWTLVKLSAPWKCEWLMHSPRDCLLLFLYLLLIGGLLLYNIVMAFAIHPCESATGILMYPLLPLPTPSGCRGAPALHPTVTATLLPY